LAHAFKIQVIAEGVKTESQLTFLKSLGCDYLQGYLIGGPNHAEYQHQLMVVTPLFAE
jgi:diguanylate cyclase